MLVFSLHWSPEENRVLILMKKCLRDRTENFNRVRTNSPKAKASFPYVLFCGLPPEGVVPV